MRFLKLIIETPKIQIMNTEYTEKVNLLSYIVEFFKAIYFLFYAMFTIVIVNLKYVFAPRDSRGFSSQIGDFINTTFYQSDLKSEEVQ